MQSKIVVAALLLALASCKPVDPAAETPVSTDPQPAAAATAATTTGTTPAAQLQVAELDIGRKEVKPCNIEAVDDTNFSGSPIAVKKDGEFTVSGYLLDAESKTVPEQLRLRLVSFTDPQAWEAPIEGRVDRPGLPEYLKIGPWALRSGFVQKVSLAGLNEGRYRLEVSVVSGDSRLVCDQGREIAITP